MTSRLVVLFSNFRRLVSPVRKKLVPKRSTGPHATSNSIFYTVETWAGSRTWNIIQICYQLLQKCLVPGVMSSHQEKVTSCIIPPAAVCGIKSLDRKLFSRSVSIPGLKVPVKHVHDLSRVLKLSLFKMMRLKPIADLGEDDPQCKTHKLFLLDPNKFKTSNDFSAEDVQKLAEFGVKVQEFSYFDIELGYDNWSCPEVLRAVLPENTEGVSSYSIIGHIAHLNLKPEVMDYKNVIGEIILDKNATVRTVVNKLNIIDNTFRNFQMELVAGERNFITRAKENGCVFEMDFSKVYWNPRLATEHQRVVDMLKRGDILYDVFAGVGPFSIPAAKKGVRVYANDLNPDSYAALVNNVKLNKVKAGRLHPYNLDGRDFIQTVVKQELKTRLTLHLAHLDTGNGSENHHHTIPVTESEMGKGDDDFLWSGQSYIAMNLPALALDFLDTFCGLLCELPKDLQTNPSVLEVLPTVVCYCFSKSEEAEADVRMTVEGILGRPLPADSQIRSVRNVAPNKEMKCVTFRLTPEMVFRAPCTAGQGAERQEDVPSEDEEPCSKKQKISEVIT